MQAEHVLTVYVVVICNEDELHLTSSVQGRVLQQHITSAVLITAEHPSTVLDQCLLLVHSVCVILEANWL
jgi:hypothetical protein